jgi:DNA-binding transcriptional LysR family regulator
MRLFEVLSVFVLCATFLRGPNRSFASLNQVARRASVTDDKLRRAIAALSREARDPLVEVKGRRLVLTTIGDNLLSQAERLLATCRGQTEHDDVEVMAVAVADDIEPEIVTNAVRDFFKEWETFPLTLRIQRLDPETMAEAIRSGSIAFAVGWEGDENTGCSIERLEPGASWRVLVPLNHELASQDKPVTMANLVNCRIFLPSSVIVSAHRLASSLVASPSVNRVEVDSKHTVRTIVAAGLGVGLDLEFGTDSNGSSESFRRLPLVGLDPEHLCLYLPKNPSELSEPAKFLIASIRDAIRDASLPPIPSLDELPLPEPELPVL